VEKVYYYRGVNLDQLGSRNQAMNIAAIQQEKRRPSWGILRRSSINGQGADGDSPTNFWNLEARKVGTYSKSSEPERAN